MKRFNQLILILVLYFFTFIIYAGNLSFLKDSAVSNFTGKDSDLMWANTINALDHYPDGKKAGWKNLQSGSWGYAIPSHTTRTNGRTCRNLLIFNEAGHVPGQSSFTFCKIGNEWKIVE